MQLIYILLLCARFLMCYWQTGYIHPDEYMQSIEPAVGKFLRTNVTLSWEFQSRTPVRSWLSVMLAAGIPVLAVTPTTPRSLLLCVRCWMAAVSALTDFCLYCTARMLSVDPGSALLLYASSYVTLVLACRPLSNSLELPAFAAFVCLCVRATIGVNRCLLQLRMRTRNYEENMRRNRSMHRFQLLLARRALSTSVMSLIRPLSLLLGLGVFVRPTFLLYALVPLAYWLLMGTSAISRLSDFGPELIRRRLFSLIVHSAAVCTGLVLVDSHMYGWLHSLLDFDLDQIVCAPFNFVAYNLRATNLISHGHHWRLTHLLVNVPLLFGPVGVCQLFHMLSHAVSAVRHLFLLCDPHLCSARVFLLAQFIVPLALLSWFPHQEPRFLMPLLFPLCLLHANRFNSCTRTFKCLWLAHNMLCLLFYGFTHQAGVVPSLVRLHDSLLASHSSHRPIVHVVYHRTYTVPQSLLLLPKQHAPHLHETGGRLSDLQLAEYLGGLRGGPTLLVAPEHTVRWLNSSSSGVGCRCAIGTCHRVWPHFSAETFDWRRVVDGALGSGADGAAVSTLLARAVDSIRREMTLLLCPIHSDDT